jgi:hypothetical protein
MKPRIFVFLLIFASACHPASKPSDESKWISLFNGKDLSGWEIKIAHHPLNENFKDIFTVRDGVMHVSYEKLDSFHGEFGHIFYNQKFSKYKLRLEYRFFGEQCPGGPEWAIRNSGAMLHCQSPESMGLDQSFPVSIEAQFLGGLDTGERPTLSVCTPGTDIDFLGQPAPNHCTGSSSKTFNGDQWVTAEMVVLGDSIIHHIVNGDTVMTYTKPRVGPDQKPEGYPLPDGTPIQEGYIALQAESHGVEFRNVQLMDLSGNK